MRKQAAALMGPVAAGPVHVEGHFVSRTTGNFQDIVVVGHVEDVIQVQGYRLGIGIVQIEFFYILDGAVRDGAEIQDIM